MAKAENENCKCSGGAKNVNQGATASGGALYGFGLFGALYFYLSTAGSFGEVVLGIIKALVWPGIMVFHLFKYLGL
jgi:hypothetical protein